MSPTHTKTIQENQEEYRFQIMVSYIKEMVHCLKLKECDERKVIVRDNKCYQTLK